MANSHNNLNAATNDGSPTKRIYSSLSLAGSVDDMPAVKKQRDEKVNPNHTSSSSSKDLQAEAKKIKIYNLTGDGHFRNDRGEYDSYQYFPYGIPQIILVEYVGGDYGKKDNIDQPVVFFGIKVSSLMNAEVIRIANSFLCEKDEEELKKNLALIDKQQGLLHYYVIATDHLGRKVQGRLLEIALMAGMDRDVIKFLASKLSPAAVVEQFDVVMGDKAKKENEATNSRISAAIAEFGEGILRSSLDRSHPDEVKVADLLTLETLLVSVLELNSNQVRTKGDIFDPKNLVTLLKWFTRNVNRFDSKKQESIKYRVFLNVGINSLQNRLSLPVLRFVTPGIDALNLKKIAALSPDKSFFFDDKVREDTGSSSCGEPGSVYSDFSCFDSDESSLLALHGPFAIVHNAPPVIVGWERFYQKKSLDLQAFYQQQKIAAQSSENINAGALDVSAGALATSGIFSSSIRVAAAASAASTATAVTSSYLRPGE